MEPQNSNSKPVTANEDCSQPADEKPIAKPPSFSDQRSVSFSSIDIREYPLCMGDNPGCLRGVSLRRVFFWRLDGSLDLIYSVFFNCTQVPISMDWKHTKEKSLSLDEYEESRGEPIETTAIPPHKRFEMLQGTQLYTRCEIMKTLQKVESDRERRKASSRDSEKEEYIEGLKRGFLNKTLRRKKKQKEREMLLPYLSQNSLKKSGLRRSLSTASTSCESNSLDDDHLSDVDGEIEPQLEIQT